MLLDFSGDGVYFFKKDFIGLPYLEMPTIIIKVLALPTIKNDR